MSTDPATPLPPDLMPRLRRWAAELGFDALGVSDIDLGPAGARLQSWLERGAHGDMHFMAAHGERRARPDLLVPGTLRVISARCNYLPENAAPAWGVLDDPRRGYVARYALGRDYHRLLRRRLQRLAERLIDAVGPCACRVFVDSGPVMEKPLAEQAGLGWVGKHTNLLDRDGSWFFLGEIYTDLPLPIDAPSRNHCGTCQACIDVCPTRAIIAPYRLDARLCISYLTIELQGAIPEPLRAPIGNRIYGCDDCQLVCPWNRFARPSGAPDFLPRHGLDQALLIDLFGWSETQFRERCAGSPLWRLGHTRWLRNIAVALGNAPTCAAVVAALQQRRDHPEALVREHVGWALARHGER